MLVFVKARWWNMNFQKAGNTLRFTPFGLGKGSQEHSTFKGKPVSDEVDFRAKKITRDKEEHHIIKIKRSIY